MSSKKNPVKVEVSTKAQPKAEEFDSSSDDDSVIEATKESKSATIPLLDKPAKTRKPFVMTEARKASIEKMRAARGANVETRREAKDVEKAKVDAGRALLQKLKDKKKKKTQREIEELAHLQDEISSDEEEEEEENVPKPKAKAAPKKKPAKVVCYSSDDESEDDVPKPRKKQPVNIVINNGREPSQKRGAPKAIGLFV